MASEPEPHTPPPAAETGGAVAAARPAPVKTTLGLLLPFAVTLLIALLVVGTAALALRWALTTEDGSRRLLGLVPGLTVQGQRGALLGARLGADRIEYRSGPGATTVVIEGLAAEGAVWRWRPEPGVWIGLDLERLAAARVTVKSGPPSGRPPTVPTALRAPVIARIGRVALEELRIDALRPIGPIAAEAFAFDGRAGAEHRIGRLSARGYGIGVEARGAIGANAPLAVQAEATVAPTLYPGDGPPWAAAVRATGALAALDLAATLRGVPREPGLAVPAVDLSARVQPFAAWPVQRLVARTEALDLSALAGGAPQTLLEGTVDARAAARDAPIAAAIDLVNRRPGRWNEKRLPASRLQVELRGELTRPDRLEAAGLALQLADARGPAGRITGQAAWTAHRLQTELRLDAVAPQRLDARAATMQLSGPLALELDGLPSPDPAATGARPPWQVALKTALEGRIEGAPTAVQLEAEAAAQDGLVEIKRLRAGAGTAQADLNATLRRLTTRAPRPPARAGTPAAATGPDWQLATAGTLTDFDPLPWWPGAAEAGAPQAGAAATPTAARLRAGPNRLNAGWQLDLRVPGHARELPPLALLQSLAGNGRLRLQESVLAGVALGGEVAIGYARGGTGAQAGSVQADFTAGGNRITLEGQGDPAGPGDADRWQAVIDAPALAALAPLARLSPALADWVPRQGRVQAQAQAAGRWPALKSEGQARIEQLRAGTLALARGEARWQLEMSPDAPGRTPVALQVELAEVALGAQRADQLRADVRGTLAEHRIDVAGALPVAPPAMAEQLLGLERGRGTRVALAAQGGWAGDAAGGGGRWRAQVERLAVGPWSGATATAANTAAAWLDATDLRAELGFDRGGTLRTLRADPGRVRIARDIALRWDAVQATLGDARADFELRAAIEPFRLAPMLARAQPTMGWTGDLQLGGRVVLRAAERFEAEAVFERTDGDLHIAGSDGLQLLGLDDFRLALTARDGLWTFEPRFQGRILGEVAGTVRVRTAPERRWPDADAPIEGQVQARVADLGIWSAWVPPGWRLVGEVRTTASLGGRFGAPTYTGELSAQRLGVRNLLQGVNVADGQVLIRLAGDTARIERFTLRGGEGRAELTGTAVFGEKPSASLALVAERFRVLGRVDRQLTASGRAEMRLGGDADERVIGRLDGSFRIDEGLFDFSRADAPSLDDDVTVRDRPVAEAAGTDAARPRRYVALGLDIDLGENLRARGRGIETGLTGKLRITNPNGRLAVNGSVFTKDGTYQAYGQKLELERGEIAFGGALDNPRLDVLAIRPNLDQRVGLAITGTTQSPRVRLFSDPELGETDKLSWLLLGRAPDGLGRNDTAILQRAAIALLSGEGEAPTDALMRNLGIDELSLRQGDGDVRETVISLGKQLSRRWYLGYERGVNATTGTWQLIYRIAQRFTLRAQSGQESSLDVIWVWRLQEAPVTPPEGGVRKSVPAVPR